MHESLAEIEKYLDGLLELDPEERSDWNPAELIKDLEQARMWAEDIDAILFRHPDRGDQHDFRERLNRLVNAVEEAKKRLEAGPPAAMPRKG